MAEKIGIKPSRRMGFSSTGNRGFKSVSLQRGVPCEPDFLDQGAEKFADRVAASVACQTTHHAELWRC